CFWAFNKNFVGPPLVLIDYDQQPFSTTLFVGISARLHAEAVPTCARARKLVAPAALALQASSALGERVSDLIAQSDIAGARAADVIIEEIDLLLRDRDALLIACAGQIGIGKVKLAPSAQTKSQRLPCPLFELRPGAPQSAAADSAMTGIAAA